MPKENKKMTLAGREYVFSQFKEGEKSNQPIMEGLKKKFGVSVSSSYITQLRKIQTTHDMTFMSRDVEKKIKEKIKIDANILEIARQFTDGAKEWLKANKENIPGFNPKEIAMVTSAFHKFFKSYQEMAGGTERKETSQTFLIELDKRAELKRRDRNGEENGI